MGVFVQATLQLAFDPVRASAVQALLSLHVMAEQTGVAGATSQVSPLSTAPLPHTAAQSLSLFRLQAPEPPPGQQPSPPVHAVMGVFVQATLQLAFDPVRASAVQALPSLHVMAEQTTAAGATSQVSPVSMRPLPQPGQSTSIVGPHPVGQNPSAGPQVRLVVVQRYVQAPTLPDEVRTLSTSDTQAVICVMQALGGSQVSPVSTRPLPQPGQSTSIVGPHPVGQNPSAGPQVRRVVAQTYVQALTLPDEVRMLSASDTHAVIWVVQALGGSQVSPASTTLLPQAGWQSVSLLELQLDGQQPSLFAHAVCKLPLTHRTSQVAALPARTRSWQPTAGQAVGQLPSHSSPASTTPFPQRTTQSASLLVLQPAGQHASFGVQVLVVAPFTQRASQVDALPCSVRCWQPTAGQAVGQLPSHNSPGSTTLLPQRGGQSESLTLVQAVGQQASPFMHVICMPVATQVAWQVPAPVSARSWQPLARHEVGQVDTGSHVSPDSTRPLPQPAQSTSVAAEQAVGQHESAIAPLQAIAAQGTGASGAGPSTGGRSAGASIGAVSGGRSVGASAAWSGAASIGGRGASGGRSAGASTLPAPSPTLWSAPPSDGSGALRRPPPHPAPAVASTRPHTAIRHRFIPSP